MVKLINTKWKIMRRLVNHKSQCVYDVRVDGEKYKMIISIYIL